MEVSVPCARSGCRRYSNSLVVAIRDAQVTSPLDGHVDGKSLCMSRVVPRRSWLTDDLVTVDHVSRGLPRSLPVDCSAGCLVYPFDIYTDSIGNRLWIGVVDGDLISVV